MRETCNEVVLVDLDGTIASTGHRYHLAPTTDPESSWSAYAQACVDDIPIASVIKLVRMLYPHYLVHIISGRDGSAWEQTVEWLSLHEVPFDRLTMRSPGNEDSNADIKVKYANGLKAEGLCPVLLLDDWSDTIDAMHSAGHDAILVGNMKRLEPDAGNTFSGDVTAVL
jgi:hypothetical protein